MEPRLRLATHDDLPALVALYAELHPADEPAPPERLAAVLQEIVASRHFELALAEQGGRAVGTCYLNVVPNLSRGAAPYGVIENVVVTQAVRGTGVGKAVVRFALARAWARGCYKVMLQTGSRSPATHGFYRACGFSQTEKLAFLARPEPSPPRTS
jgi:GNAT superfamily N-acetyltransferase